MSRKINEATHVAMIELPVGTEVGDVVPVTLEFDGSVQHIDLAVQVVKTYDPLPDWPTRRWGDVLLRMRIVGPDAP